MLTGLRTLVLNSNYMPISLFPLHTIPAEDAVTRCFNETCHVVFDYNRKIKTAKIEMNWPSVIARNDMLKVKEKVKLRAESIFYRDHGRCAYCLEPITIKSLTFDHVHPQSLGGPHTWENVVAACPRCNLKKSNKLPEGEWVPKTVPHEPTYYQLLAERRKFPITVPDENWVPFLGKWESEIIVKGG